MSTIEEFREILSRFAQHEKVTADLFRRSGPRGWERPTGAQVVFGSTQGRWFLELRKIRAELPTNVRIEDDRVFGSSEEWPDKWEPLDEEGEELRVFTLLDPRRLIQQMYRVDFRSEGARTIVLGRVDLAKWEPGLPETFVSWLKGDAHDRVVTLEFQGHQLAAIVQPDLPPWRGDLIVARFVGWRGLLRKSLGPLFAR